MEMEHNGCIGHPITNLLNEQAAQREAEAAAKAQAKAEAAAKKQAAKKSSAKKK